ncbi:DUF1461 domain-containing protein [Halioxenophilus sp. WMMB6]|uniref:lipoprotein intramolecular transacylase Lit n=1 Tax=Halioxenophilus sp. WMMB6 TaxID=3073815 RepID=UPI00295F150F|nr:DUF1461 domain-containing protein [Halioxenophilus sp. WMMB6]
MGIGVDVVEVKEARFSAKVLLSVPFVLASIVMVLWLSWQLLSALNFSYPLWYRVLHIPAHIEKYAPQNSIRKDFSNTTAEERYRLFGEVVDAINSGGEGLAEIEYHDVNGVVIDTMYTESEVLHLQDVANLITAFDYLSYFAILVVIGYSIRYLGYWGGAPIKPNWRALHAAVAGLLLACVAIIFVIGPKEVFYFAHRTIFPPDHPWLFYYQESLMSTSMKAPDLFGGLAVEWLLFALTGYYLWIYFFGYLIKRRIREQENR